jgi:beta-glucosidase
MTAKEAGNYEIRLQTSGGRGSIQFETAAGAAPPTGRGGRGGGGGAASLLPTAGGLTNAVVMQPFEAGQSRTFTLTATAGASSPMEIRLAWIPPGWRTKKIAEAADAARKARTAIVFAYDEGSEGRDRPSISLPGEQDQLIEAIAAANPRTVVVLNNGAPIVMPWADHVAAILQMWYPGQEGAKATSDILTGAASPGGRLPVTFPRRLEDGPTADPARYPGVDGHGEYSEGVLVGYRWYDTQHVEPLFPFGHGLSYTTFAYSNASFVKTADGLSLRVTVKNTGTRAGDEVVQVYAGPPPSPAVPIAAKSLAAFQRVTLAPGAAQVLTLPLEPHAWSYWSTSTHAWEIAPGMRTFSIGASSRDIRLTLDLDIAHR